MERQFVQQLGVGMNQNLLVTGVVEQLLLGVEVICMPKE